VSAESDVTPTLGDRWESYLDDHRIRVVEVWIPDINGSVKGKWYPVDSFKEFARKGITFPNALLSWTRDALMYDDIPYSNPTHGFPDLSVTPDLSTLRPMPWREGHAAVLCHMATTEGEPISVDPRDVLLQQVNGLRTFGLEPSCSLEYEFCLLERNGEPTNYRHEGYDFVLPDVIDRFLESLTVQLVDFGLPVAVGHTEWGTGQMEIALRPCDAMEAADKAVMLKAAIKSMAHEMKLIASFMAKPFADQPGNGLHVNQSLWGDQGSNIFADSSGNSGTINRCIGGLVSTAAEFSLLGASTINAYKRRTGGQFAPATATWSRINRTAAIRALLDRGATSRIEFRGPSSDCNPYLGLTAGLAGCLYGLRNDVDLPQELSGSAYDAEETNNQLPTNLSQALDLFEGSDGVHSLLGKDFVHHYATLVRHEVTDFNQAVTDWERERYLRYA
jgi:glutamine synthetase